MTTDPLIGRVLANYRLDHLLGRGGMAQVYYGWDVRLQRPVAVKVIDTRYRGDPAYAQRFVHEAQMVATWRHENIAQVYYADEDSGLYYFAMEYIDGQDVGQVLAGYTAKGELMPLVDVLRVGRAIATALDYAHQKGVIHRDVKPSNVIMAQAGRVVLTDFGLALEIQQGSLGEVFGSAHYIAPEQARRSSDALPQSDQYSLVVILYEMLAGVVPFDDPSPTALALHHLTLPPPSPREFNPDISVEVETVLFKGMSKSPRDRYLTNVDFITALETALSTSQPAPVRLASLPSLPAGMHSSTPRPVSVSPKVDQPKFLVGPPTSSPSPQPIQSPSLPNVKVSPPAATRPDALARSFVIGISVIAAVLILAVGGAFLLTQRGEIAPTSPPGMTRAATQAAAASVSNPPTVAPSPRSTVIPVTLEPTQLIQVTSTDTPTSPPIPALGTAAPTTAAFTPSPSPTVKYPSGKRFVLYYDDNSLYLLNRSESLVSIYSVAFERLDSAGSPQNRFDGWRWGEFYPTSRPGGCMSIEILSSSPYLRSPECNGIYFSTRTPLRTDSIIFWTTQAGSQQFRVVWRGESAEEEVVRCEIEAGYCEVYFP